MPETKLQNQDLGDSLNDYYTSGVVDAAIATALADYTTTADMNTAISAQVAADVPPAVAGELANYYTKAEIDANGWITDITGQNLSTADNTTSLFATGDGSNNISQFNNDSGFISDITGQNLSTANNDSGWISDITGQDLSTASNATSLFLVAADLATIEGDIAALDARLDAAEAAIADHETRIVALEP